MRWSTVVAKSVRFVILVEEESNCRYRKLVMGNGEK